MTDRKTQIIDAAVSEAKVHGYRRITRAGIAARAGVSEALVSHHTGTMVSLKRDVMRAAIRDEILSIVAEGLADKDKQARKAPEHLRQAAANHIAGV